MSSRFAPRTAIAVSLIQRELDRKSTRLNSSHTEIYTLSLHDALPISLLFVLGDIDATALIIDEFAIRAAHRDRGLTNPESTRSEEHTSELQSHRDLHSFPTRRSSDLAAVCAR